MKTNIIPCCRVQLNSSLNLEELGEIISNRALGGIQFIGRDEHIRDEAPAIYTKSNVLGARFILMQEPDVDHIFHLECDSQELVKSLTVQDIRSARFDISVLVKFLLEGDKRIQVI
jgi:hypothetical protein